jgi:YD repeat-containing protein
LKGLTSRCDASNRIVYYDYDVLGRIVLIRDQDRNILKKICYNYAGQPEDCNVYVNSLQTGTFYKQVCTGCQVGSAVIDTVQAGLYSSTLSSDDANSKAQAEIAANGQANANAKEFVL